MITIREFKEQHNLSDSAFKRLVKKAKQQYPGSEFTRRLNSTQWEVLHPTLLESLISSSSELESADPPAPTPTIAADLELQPLDLSALQTLMPPQPQTIEVIPAHTVRTIADLTVQGNQLTVGQTEVALALEVVQQTRQLVGYVLSIQREQTVVDDQQVTQLEDAAFELQVHANCLKREDRRVSIEQGYRNQRRTQAQSRVVEMRDFFDRRTVSQP